MRHSRECWAGLMMAWVLVAGLGPALPATLTLLPNAEQTFVDINGQPLAAGTVGFYIPGTLTPKATWKDPNGSVVNTNPVVLDAAGRAIIYGAGSYRQIVKDVFGDVIWDQLTAGSGGGAVVVNGAITSSIVLTSCSGTYPVNNVSLVLITITMETAPTAGDSCQFVDASNTSGTYPVTFLFGSNTLNTGGSTWVMNSNGYVVGFTWLGTPAKWAAQ